MFLKWKGEIGGKWTGKRGGSYLSSHRNSFISTMCGCFNAFSRRISVMILSTAVLESFDLSTHLMARASPLAWKESLVGKLVTLWKIKRNSPFLNIGIHRRRCHTRSSPAVESPLFWVGQPLRVRSGIIIGDTGSRADFKKIHFPLFWFG